jgi:hypothetical protein
VIVAKTAANPMNPAASPSEASGSACRVITTAIAATDTASRV